MNMGGEMTLAERALASLDGKVTPSRRAGEDATREGQSVNIGVFLRDYSEDTRGERPVNIGPHIEQWFSLTRQISAPGEFSRCDQLGIDFADLPFCT